MDTDEKAGSGDPIVLEDWAITVTALVPGAVLETVRGPHVVMFTDPVGVAAAIAGHAKGGETRA